MSVKDFEKWARRGDSKRAFEAWVRVPVDAQRAHALRLRTLIEADVAKLQREADWSKLSAWSTRLDQAFLRSLSHEAHWSLFLGAQRCNAIDQATQLLTLLHSAHPALAPLLAALGGGKVTPSLHTLAQQEAAGRRRMGYVEEMPAYALTDVELVMRACHARESAEAFRRQVDAWLKDAPPPARRLEVQRLAFRLSLYGLVVDNDGQAGLATARWVSSWVEAAHIDGCVAEAEALFRALFVKARNQADGACARTWLELLPLWVKIDALKPLVEAAGRELVTHATGARLAWVWSQLKPLMGGGALALWVLQELDRRNAQIVQLESMSAILKAPAWFDELMLSAGADLVALAVEAEHPEALARAAAALMSPTSAIEFVDRYLPTSSETAASVFLTPLMVGIFSHLQGEAAASALMRSGRRTQPLVDDPFELFEEAMGEAHNTVTPQISRLYERWRVRLDVSVTEAFELAIRFDETKQARKASALRFLQARADAKSWSFALHELTESVPAQSEAYELVEMLGGANPFCSVEVLRALVPIVNEHGPRCTTRKMVNARVKGLVETEPLLAADPIFSKVVNKPAGKKRSSPAKTAGRKRKTATPSPRSLFEPEPT